MHVVAKPLATVSALTVLAERWKLERIYDHRAESLEVLHGSLEHRDHGGVGVFRVDQFA